MRRRRCPGWRSGRSHHLKLLRKAGLIDCERRGTWVYYWPLPEMTDRLAGILTRPAGMAGSAWGGSSPTWVTPWRR
ncbi:transcriptional regulator, ArsR family [Streptomyces iranensis]|uniref:Transcriptional regulator, ArsR family n=1 Tax=Streptomyces iranensis TaxID=576784 RepID=A0A060ZNS3_9ACTN|nr:hypothetical protein [Streptomyces iranensis]CDR07516.1 transcriptional regulator, ArsR family [Streptomyces iranensis]